MTLLGFMSAISLGLFILGFFISRREDYSGVRDQFLVWIIDTILWFVWAYMVFNEATYNPLLGNSYIPIALAIVGAGFVLVCIYKDITLALEFLRNRPHALSSSEQYDEDKRRNNNHIYNITRRRF